MGARQKPRIRRGKRSPAPPAGRFAARTRQPQQPTALARPRPIEPDIQAAAERYGSHRVAVVIGTSTSGADENIPLFAHAAQGGAWAGQPFKQLQHTMGAPAEFAAHVYGLHGLRYTVSTACTSGARALISAARLLRANLADAVLCGGADTLSPLTINGFAALEVLSDGIANPFSARRNGINIGEAAAAFVMTRDADFGGGMQLLGYGASSDAHHMSSPRPDGLGAAQAFQAAPAPRRARGRKTSAG
ncbi:3-oxoacyl-[acyl-carrier-protein] synthase 2 [Kingella potus]|uniref:3-oxoacyl-[acyl-carrier-protein] synthase 2 n=1 Tax=Kingella potus TaxID=265175 RepID=A0A377R3S3_9NEIS|nr:3-oxoacyl-[acyl-carrier-protein] synthase 2 [Kingella potus]